MLTLPTLEAIRAAGGSAPLAELVCPRCRGTLNESEERYHCQRCRADYPILLGIPDFRLEPDPWIGLAEDRAKGERLARETEGADFEQVVRAYWAMTPSTPAPMADRFIRYVLDGERRSDEWLAYMLTEDGGSEAGPWLEIGCGTGDFVGAARARGFPVVGIDVAFRWLVVASRRPGLAGSGQLVCCNAEHLPFPEASWSRVVSAGTIEHCRDAARALSEAARVLRPGGRLRARTVNRYAVTREPHVGVWGVGFVPRRWSDRYVRWRTGQRYLHHKPLSARELARGARDAGLVRVQVSAAAVMRSDRARLPIGAHWLSDVYERARSTRGVSALLRVVAPILELTGVKR